MGDKKIMFHYVVIITQRKEFKKKSHFLVNDMHTKGFTVLLFVTFLEIHQRKRWINEERGKYRKIDMSQSNYSNVN